MSAVNWVANPGDRARNLARTDMDDNNTYTVIVSFETEPDLPALLACKPSAQYHRVWEVYKPPGP